MTLQYSVIPPAHHAFHGDNLANKWLDDPLN